MMCHNIDLISKTYPEFKIEDGYVFKSCKSNYMVALKKLEDTQTNEARTVYDSRYAKYRASHLLVVKIFNKFNCKNTRSMFCNSTNIWDPINRRLIKNKTTYVVGEIVRSDSFDTDIDNICSNGIHYYKTIEAAFYHDICFTNYTGKVTGWYDDGRLECDAFLSHGQRHGKFTLYWEDGTKKAEGEYSNGQKTRFWTTYSKKGETLECVVYNKDRIVYEN